MKVETYIVTWNREDVIHLTVNYYKQLGKVIVYDNFSDDKTREICESLGAEVRLFGRAGVLDDQAYIDVKNNCWKGSQADWVIIVDDDEILWHPNLLNILIESTICSIPVCAFKPNGYSIYSDSMPINSWLEITTGFEDEKYSKICCFNPQKIQSINYVYGCHECNPVTNGISVIANRGINLLHYHGVGGAERMIKRHQLYEPRRQKSQVNMRWGLGKEYGYSAESKRKWFQEQLEKSSTLFEDGTRF